MHRNAHNLQADCAEQNDNLLQWCQRCGNSVIIGYWDEELESYIYLRDNAICHNCGG